MDNDEKNVNNTADPNRNYKDSVFVDLHSNDKILSEQAVIDIYNALFCSLKSFYCYCYVWVFIS